MVPQLFLTNPTVKRRPLKDFTAHILPKIQEKWSETNSSTKCRDPGSNRGPLDLQSNALPTELSRPVLCSWRPKRKRSSIAFQKEKVAWQTKTNEQTEKETGPTEIWTRIAGFRVQSANHYTIGPCCDFRLQVQKQFLYLIFVAAIWDRWLISQNLFFLFLLLIINSTFIRLWINTCFENFNSLQKYLTIKYISCC